MSTGAIAAHEAALARDPVAGAGAREPDRPVRPRRELGQGRGALPRGRRARRRQRRAALRLRRAPRPAGAVGRRRRGYRRALARQSAARAGAQQPRADSRAAAASSTRRLAEYRQAVESQPTFRLARFNLGRMLLALGQADEAIVELEKLTEPRDAEAPRYLFALSTAHVRGRPQAPRRSGGRPRRRQPGRSSSDRHDLARAIDRGAGDAEMSVRAHRRVADAASSLVAAAR